VNRLLSAIFFCLRAFSPCGSVLAIFSIQFSKVTILGDGDLRAASVFDFLSWQNVLSFRRYLDGLANFLHLIRMVAWF
jgi:hypothetical protein